MKRKRFSEEQIIGILRESEAGAKTKELCRKHGVSDATFYNWKAKYAGMTVSEARRLRELEHENTAEKAAGGSGARQSGVEGSARPKMVSPQAKHEAVAVLQTEHRMKITQNRLQGLYDEVRPGRPRTIDDERVAGLIRKVLNHKPKNGATHWSTRTAEAEIGISKSSVHRYLSLFGFKPHRTESFRLSTNVFFIEKLRDVVGLYLNPPDNALVLSVDEKIQVKALERTQPMLPTGLGYIEGVTHDYKGHGTTTLFAALDVLKGKVIAECKPRYRHQEFLAFLRRIEEQVPQRLDIHLIVDNYSTHKHAKVKAWLAKRPRWHIHFIPTYSSWLNQVERFFALITDRAIRRGSFRSTRELVQKIDHFVTRYNRDCQPFMWTATANSILAQTRTTHITN